MNGPASADRKNPEEAPRTERLTVAALRRAVPIRLWGGKGCGVPCDFCRVLVSPTEVEYEVEARAGWRAGDPALSSPLPRDLEDRVARPVGAAAGPQTQQGAKNSR